MPPCSTDTEINYNEILIGKGYPCPLCGKLFNKKSNLDTHMGMHTGLSVQVTDHSLVQSVEKGFDKRST